MPVAPKDFIDKALEIIDHAECVEIDCRNAISRAYYSAYHYALLFATRELGEDVENLTGGTHKKLCDLLSTYICNNKEAQREIWLIATKLRLLHTARVRADYHIDETVTSKDARTNVRQCGELALAIHETAKKVAA